MERRGRGLPTQTLPPADPNSERRGVPGALGNEERAQPYADAERPTSHRGKGEWGGLREQRSRASGAGLGPHFFPPPHLPQLCLSQQALHSGRQPPHTLAAQASRLLTLPLSQPHQAQACGSCVTESFAGASLDSPTEGQNNLPCLPSKKTCSWDSSVS